MKFFRDEEGSGMVEFAIVTTVFFVPLLFGIIEFGRLVWARNMIAAAAREGTRFAVVRGLESGSTADSLAVASYVQGRTKLSPISVSPIWTGTKQPGDDVIVTVRYTHVPVVKIPGLLTNKTITAKSTQIIHF